MTELADSDHAFMEGDFDVEKIINFPTLKEYRYL